MIELFCDYLGLIRILRVLSLILLFVGIATKLPPILIGGGISSFLLWILLDIGEC